VTAAINTVTKILNTWWAATTMGLIPSDRAMSPISETPPGANDKNRAEKLMFVTLTILQA